MKKAKKVSKKVRKVVTGRAQPANTLITLLLDETGSMTSCRDQTISGVNEFLKAQAHVPGQCSFDLVLFNSERVQRSGIKAIEDFEPLTQSSYVPRAVTPLYDAVGSTIRALEAELGKMREQPDQVLFVVMTDGYENASREWNETSVRQAVEAHQKGSSAWQFVFLGANMDEWAAATKIGGAMMATNSAAYDNANIGAAMQSLSENTAAYRVQGVRTTASFWSATGRPPRLAGAPDRSTRPKRREP